MGFNIAKNIIIGLKAWVGGIVVGIVAGVLFGIFAMFGITGGIASGSVGLIGIAYILLIVFALPLSLYIHGLVLNKWFGWK